MRACALLYCGYGSLPDADSEEEDDSEEDSDSEECCWRDRGEAARDLRGSLSDRSVSGGSEGRPGPRVANRGVCSAMRVTVHVGGVVAVWVGEGREREREGPRYSSTAARLQWMQRRRGGGEKV